VEPTTDPIVLARRIADRWIREERYKWLIYHTNITHYGLMRLSRAGGGDRYLAHVRDAYHYYRTELQNELTAPDFHMHVFGIAEAELLAAADEPELRELVLAHTDALLQRQNRSPDGAFVHRDGNTVFVDCLAGIVPFLAKVASLTNDSRCLDEAYRQVQIYYSRLVKPATPLVTQGEGCHIFDDWPGSYRRQTDGAWARGNGWMALALAELMSYMPQDHPYFEALLTIYARFCAGLLDFQDTDGMWHQIVDRPDAYQETSGTALIAYALARGVRSGWLDASVKAAVERSYAGLTAVVEEDATIHGTCIGTPFQASEKAYFRLPAPVDDLHGHGPIILLCSELAQLRSEQG